MEKRERNPGSGTQPKLEEAEVHLLLEQMRLPVMAFFAKAARRPLGGYREHMEMPWGHLYLRTSRRLFQAGIVRCLDIGQIEIYEGYRGRGFLTPLLQNLDTLNPYEAMYIEHVASPILVSWCQKHGWQKVETNPPSFYISAPSNRDIKA